MSSKECIDRFSEYLFWDVNKDALDMNEYPTYIIPRVLEYGTMDDWRLARDFYGLDKIVEVCKSIRTLDPMCLSYICAISHTPKEDYRCWHFRQSFPTLWNS